MKKALLPLFCALLFLGVATVGCKSSADTKTDATTKQATCAKCKKPKDKCTCAKNTCKKCGKPSKECTCKKDAKK